MKVLLFLWLGERVTNRSFSNHMARRRGDGNNLCRPHN